MPLPTLLRVSLTCGEADRDDEGEDKSELDCRATCGEPECDGKGEEEPLRNWRVTPSGGCLRLPPTCGVADPNGEREGESKHNRRATSGEADDAGEGDGEGEEEFKRSQGAIRSGDPFSLSMLSQASKVVREMVVDRIYADFLSKSM